MARSKKMQKAVDAIREGIENYGLKADAYGHYKFVLPSGRTYRIKFQKIGYRIESKATGRWIRFKSGKFNDGLPDDLKRVLFKAKQA